MYSLNQIVRTGINAFAQEGEWNDKCTIRMWNNKIYHPHVSGTLGISGLLLDYFRCHRNVKSRIG